MYLMGALAVGYSVGTIGPSNILLGASLGWSVISKIYSVTINTYRYFYPETEGPQGPEGPEDTLEESSSVSKR